MLVSLASDAVKDRDQLRAEIEHWFDSAMDRVSGWYKRRTQLVICALSLVVTIGLNVNTVSIADRLMSDDGIRAALGGWLITFLALALGAPFWFDALGKIAGLRATGPPAKPASSG